MCILKIVGLCGGSGTGKGAASRLFSEFGFYPIDTDQVYRGLISTNSDCTQELVQAFGADILGENRLIDRKRLADAVFSYSSKERLHTLNEITHKHILNDVRIEIQKKENEGFDYVLIDAPVLYESGFDKECDFVVAILADEKIRIERIIKRDNISKTKALERIKNQKSDDFLKLNANFIIVNNGSLDNLKSEVSRVVEAIIKQTKGET